MFICLGSCVFRGPLCVASARWIRKVKRALPTGYSKENADASRETVKMLVGVNWTICFNRSWQILVRSSGSQPAGHLTATHATADALTLSFLVFRNISRYTPCSETEALVFGELV